ncbi:MAG: YccF domain-containing protein [Alphaproteobacteria bacterium]|nr:YccF domain-containing protein [Alphaproteobacteria bacterium]MBV9018507.1 YccF domain-containing protein [Alphaproteobacteria bacterium]MBV9965555.1 YccF domain-containing protein [Alphaproteobacteria bacterium]
MSPLNFLLNILWLICGGVVAALAWVVAALIMAITIIGLPWCFSAFRIALYTCLPFGQEMRSRHDAGVLSVVGNIIWFVFAGWWLAIMHLILALGLAITIIGIPFAWAHLKLAGASLAPVGTEIVPRNSPRPVLY